MPSNQQRREAAKRKLQRQLVRREQRAVAQRRRLMIVGVVAAVLIIAGGVWLFTSLGSSGTDEASQSSGTGSTAAGSTGSEQTDTSDAGTANATDTAETSQTVPSWPCSYPAAGTAAKTVQAPTNLTPANTGTVDATIAFNTGDVTIALDRANAPCAVESFLSLASQHYFDDTPCHRLTTTDGLKVLQCGDPSGTGTGGPGYSMPDELTGSETYTTGVVAMANGGPNTAGSQFFIVYGDSQLQPDYTVIGTVTEGMDVVDAIAAKGVKPGSGRSDTDGAPAETVTIQSVTIPDGAVDATAEETAPASSGAAGTGATATGAAGSTGSRSASAPDEATDTASDTAVGTVDAGSGASSGSASGGSAGSSGARASTSGTPTR